MSLRENVPQDPASSTPSESSIAPQYAPAIRQLQTIQDQITKLRPAIASLVETLTPPPDLATSTSKVYLDFARVASQALEDVKRLKASWEEQDTRGALDLARGDSQDLDGLEWEFISKGRWQSLEDLDFEIEDTSMKGD